MPAAPRVRPREDADLPELVALLARAHAAHGYPVRAGNVRAGWIAAEDALGGWVAVSRADRPGQVLGHVALHRAGGPPLPVWLEATGGGAAGLAVVSRLFTGGAVPGTGSLLLAHAQEQARGLGRHPVLEVELRSPARQFYLRRGWRQVGEVEQQWGRPVPVAVLVAPVPGPAADEAGSLPAVHGGGGPGGAD